MDGSMILLAASTLVDLIALAAAWRLFGAAGRRQRGALERLRDELAALVADAERRGRALEEALTGHETRLRALLKDAGKVEETRRGRPRDAAEARLLRDLDRLRPARSA